MKEKKSKKIKKGTNAGIQVLLCILAGGYFLFFTSKIWMPNNETLIEPTSLYARQVMDDELKKIDEELQKYENDMTRMRQKAAENEFMNIPELIDEELPF